MELVPTVKGGELNNDQTTTSPTTIIREEREMEERGVNLKGSVSVSGLISVVMADLAPLFVCLV